MPRFLAALVLTAMTAASAADKPPSAPAVRYWSLPTGSHIAYIHYASARADAVPVIFLHGGPGAYEVSASHLGLDWFRRLNAQGFDVWYYDQIGGGLSARLADPRQYTVKRHVADLEAIRQTIGAAHFIGVGESWGATLLANYMADHPGVVSRAAFVSPGWIDSPEGADPRQPPQIFPDFRVWIRAYHPEEIARYVRLDLMLRSSVVAAHRAFPDSQMDPLLDEFVNTAVSSRTVHDPARAPRHLMDGMGWWSCTMTGWDVVAHSAAPQKRLAGNRTPVLVMRPESDYLPPQAAQGYVRTFANAKFVAIPKAGHIIWLEQPALYTGTLEKFFAAAP